MNYTAILLLAGKSSRFNASINKVYLIVNDKPIFYYSLKIFLEDNKCEKIIVVYNKNDQELLSKYILKSDKIKLVEGGSERFISVLNGLHHVCTEYVLVHDGARPLITMTMVNDVLTELEYTDSVSVGLQVTDTLKKIENGNITTISRDNIYSVQTPQGAKTNILMYALNQALKNVQSDGIITDDLMAIEKYTNVVPKIVLGNKYNIKVTTPEDLEIVKAYLNILGD